MESQLASSSYPWDLLNATLMPGWDTKKDFFMRRFNVRWKKNENREKNAKLLLLFLSFGLRFTRYLHLNQPVGILLCSLALCSIVFHCSICALRRFYCFLKVPHKENWSCPRSKTWGDTKLLKASFKCRQKFSK